MLSPYKKKLQLLTHSIQAQKDNLTKAEVKLITQGQRIINKVQELEAINFGTVKKQGNQLQQGRENASPNNRNSKVQSKVENNSKQRKKDDDNKRQQKKGECQKQTALLKVRELQNQRILQQKQIEVFLTSSNKLKNLLQQQCKYIQLEFQRQKITWNQQNKSNLSMIEAYSNEMQMKNRKIDQLQENLTSMSLKLQLLEDKCKQQETTINNLQEQNKMYREQSIGIKLQNKNLKADNKIIITHLDKMINAKNRNEEKELNEAFEQKQKRIIHELYFKTIKVNASPKNIERFQAYELSNKVKLENKMDQYQLYRKETAKTILKLQDRIHELQTDIQYKNAQIKTLQLNLKKTNQLRDLEKQLFIKERGLITQYERKCQQLNKNNQLANRIKNKIGFIVSRPFSKSKNHQHQQCVS